MDPRAYINSSVYCKAIQQNLLEVGVALRIAGIQEETALVTVQQIGHLEYIYSEQELRSRAEAICREVPFETVVHVLPPLR